MLVVALGLLFIAAEAKAPVIGIYPTLTSNNYTGAYQQWVAQAGATSFIMPTTFSATELETLFNRMNGMLIPGGSRALDPSLHAMVNRAVKANQQGDFFPVWGTCLGFEWLVTIFGGAMASGFDAEYLPASVNFTAAGRASRLYKSAEASIMTSMENEKITYNAHQQGITPSVFGATAALTNVFEVISTSVDRKGKVYVSQIEGKTYPFYGNQFHPEKIEFVFDPVDVNIPRTPHAIAASRQLSAFFISEAAKNMH
jgi:gamma-glutamyl hydrolase